MIIDITLVDHSLLGQQPNESGSGRMQSTYRRKLASILDVIGLTPSPDIHEPRYARNARPGWLTRGRAYSLAITQMDRSGHQSPIAATSVHKWHIRSTGCDVKHIAYCGFRRHYLVLLEARSNSRLDS